MKVKAYELHKFNGNLRDYLIFKDDFQNLVKSVYGPDPYALKTCLVGDAFQTVRGAEGNFKQMLERLDDRYGNAKKIVNLATSNVKSLGKTSDGDTKSFVGMVDKVVSSVGWT